MLCQGAGCISGTSTGGPCLGRFGLHSCSDFVLLVGPREFCTLCNRTAASADTESGCRRLRAASMLVQSICACCLTAEATPRSTPNSAQRSMVPLHSMHCALSPLMCCHPLPNSPTQHWLPQETADRGRDVGVTDCAEAALPQDVAISPLAH